MNKKKKNSREAKKNKKLTSILELLFTQIRFHR
jgi:hypothetical protein